MSSFQYHYAPEYGADTWKNAVGADAAVDKGLAQQAREATMPFAQLCARLQRESMTHARQQRKHWRTTPYDRLMLAHKWEKEIYAGHTAEARTRYHASLALYWVEQLTPDCMALTE